MQARKPTLSAARLLLAAAFAVATAAPAPVTASPNTPQQLVPAGRPVAAAPAANMLRFVRFTDPAEHAFTVEVPVGWLIGGRLVRYGPINLNMIVQALAPDGSVYIQLGDSRIQNFDDAPGLWPGHLTFEGTLMVIGRRYETSLQFAQSYAVEFQGKLGCKNPAFSTVEAVPNPPNITLLPFGVTRSAVAFFSCTGHDKRYVGGVQASIHAARTPTGVAWQVVGLASFLAREDHAPLARAMWNEMRDSFAVDSAWNALESQIAAGAIRPTIRQWNASLDLARRFDQHVIRGEVTVWDPTIGTQSDIPMGTGPYYYSDGLGHFLPSYSPTPPPGFQRVQQMQ